MNNNNNVERKKYFEGVCSIIKNCLSKYAKYANEVPSNVGYNPKLIRGWMFFDNIVVVFFHCCITKRSNKSKLNNKIEHPFRVGNLCQIIYLGNYHLSYDSTFLCDVIEQFLNPGNAKCTAVEFLFIGEEFQNQDLSRLKTVGSSRLSLNTFVRLHYFGFAHVKCNDIYSKITQYQDRNNLEFLHAYMEADKYLTDFIFKEIIDIRLLYKGLDDWYNQIDNALGNNAWADELQKSEPALAQWLNSIKQRVISEKKDIGIEQNNIKRRIESFKKCLLYTSKAYPELEKIFQHYFYDKCDACTTLEDLESLQDIYIENINNKITTYMKNVKGNPQLLNLLFMTLQRYNLNVRDKKSISSFSNYDKCKLFVALYASPNLNYSSFDYVKFFFDPNYDNFFKRAFASEREVK